MSRSGFRVYYHLYCGPSWRRVWELHRPLLEEIAGGGLLERVVICVYGHETESISGSDANLFEIRHVAGTLGRINEFHTLHQMQRDVRDQAQKFEWCAYLHSKGASSAKLQEGGAEWSLFLARALIGSLPAFARVVERGFNSAGSNLALGLFEDFGPPRLHYSGNFWCATRDLVASAPDIELGSRYASVRHNAEWWLSRADAFVPFNVFSTGIDHYAAPSGEIDWRRLESRLEALASSEAPAARSMAQIHFLRKMVQAAVGRQALRRGLSDALLQALPHHRWRRLLYVHDRLMKPLRSRKSLYFYCAESQ